MMDLLTLSIPDLLAYAHQRGVFIGVDLMGEDAPAPVLVTPRKMSAEDASAFSEVVVARRDEIAAHLMGALRRAAT
jgi:hypothetical protein